MQKVINYVLDTNVLIADPSAVLSFSEHNVIIPMEVLEELDSIKSRGVDISPDARAAIRMIDDIIGDGDAALGIDLNDVTDGVCDGKLYVVTVTRDTLERSRDFIMDMDTPDNRIISTALMVKNGVINNIPFAPVVLVSNDINMRVKAKAFRLDASDYKKDKCISDVALMHAGHHYFDGDFSIDMFEHIISELSYTTKAEPNKPPVCVYAYPLSALEEYEFESHDYIVDSTDTFFGFVFRVNTEAQVPYVLIAFMNKRAVMNRKLWGVAARNEQQAMVFDALNRDSTDLVVITGSAGTGKTFLTMAAALDQVIEQRKFSKIVFTRSMQSQFEEVGFLPGDETDKVVPWCGAAIDALETLHKEDENPEDSIKLALSKIQFKALTFIRGRSFNDTLLIIDEAQNLTPTQIKTILTRAGENCKVVLMGNLAQIDNRFVSPLNSGLTFAVERMKFWNRCAIVNMESVERSDLAKVAEEVL